MTEKFYPLAFDRHMPLRGGASDLQKALAHLGGLQARDERGATLLLDQHGAACGEHLLILVHRHRTASSMYAHVHDV